MTIIDVQNLSRYLSRTGISRRTFEQDHALRKVRFQVEPR